LGRTRKRYIKNEGDKRMKGLIGDMQKNKLLGFVHTHPNHLEVPEMLQFSQAKILHTSLEIPLFQASSSAFYELNKKQED